MVKMFYKIVYYLHTSLKILKIIELYAFTLGGL